MTDNVSFLRVTDDSEHIRFLYDRLMARQFTISHENMPDFQHHEAFVKSSPYREWLICVLSGRWAGSVYITDTNTIGLDLAPEDYGQVPHIIQKLTDEFEPLEGIKSIRAGRFSINVAPTNRQLIEQLEAMGAPHIQSTFRL